MLPDRQSEINTSLPAESIEGAAEKIFYIALDLLTGRPPPGSRKVDVFLDQHRRDDAARVLPFVDQLIEHARIGVLRRHAQPD